MILRKQYITLDQVREFFPEILSTNDNYKYFIEVSALRLQGRKTVQSLHVSAYKERESEGMIMREIYSCTPCLRSALDKPMREAQREKIYGEARMKLADKACRLLPENHPYRLTIESM